jgi:hypothetical protein
VPYFGDHVELSHEAIDFSSTVAVERVVGTEFVLSNLVKKHGRPDLTPQRQEIFERWLHIYNDKMLSRGSISEVSTHVISANLVNALRLGFNPVHYVSDLPSYGPHFLSPDLQVPGVPHDPSVAGLTWFGFSGYRGLAEPLFTPTKSTNQDIQTNDTFSWVHGKPVVNLESN